MDTGTHMVMGIALGGLAMLDPVVSQNPSFHQAVIAGTIIGSNAPDFDTVLKLRNNAVYIRHHRGMTHSIPAVLLWPSFITMTIAVFIPDVNLLHLWLWTFLAVFLHVFVDIFNAYGTQALLPFSRKWIALGIINIFDPFIFFTHLLTISLWFAGLDPGPLFLSMYAMIFVYYVWRIVVHKILVNKVKQKIPDAEEIIVSPTIRWDKWLVSVKTKDRFFVARAKKMKIIILDRYERNPITDSSIINAAKKDKNLSAFLAFSPIYRWKIEETSNGYKVRFIDLRYRSKEHYPFVAVVKLNKKLEIQSSYTGWIYSEDRLQKKLNPANNF